MCCGLSKRVYLQVLWFVTFMQIVWCISPRFLCSFNFGPKFFFPSILIWGFLTALRNVSRLLGALINQCIWKQSCPQLGQVLRMNKIQTYLMKVGYIAWRKDKLELQNFPILIGRGISQGFCLPLITNILPSVNSCLMVLSWINYFGDGTVFQTFVFFPPPAPPSSTFLMSARLFFALHLLSLSIHGYRLLLCSALRPYPISNRRAVPARIEKPDWAADVSCSSHFFLRLVSVSVCAHVHLGHWGSH